VLIIIDDSEQLFLVEKATSVFPYLFDKAVLAHFLYAESHRPLIPHMSRYDENLLRSAPEVLRAEGQVQVCPPSIFEMRCLARWFAPLGAWFLLAQC
jgi:hypothetical protein